VRVVYRFDSSEFHCNCKITALSVLCLFCFSTPLDFGWVGLALFYLPIFLFPPPIPTSLFNPQKSFLSLILNL
jgi:hypothetical protein